MIDEPPVPPAVVAPPEAGAPSLPPPSERTDGDLVIDLTRLVPRPPAEDCGDAAPDPFRNDILVCDKAPRSPRLGPVVGPVDDGFASAVPRARMKLSDKASAEANLIKQGVGGFDGDGAEVRVKIDF